MPKEEWGVKRVCPTTGKRFYDLNQSPVVSPYTGEVVNIDTGKGSRSLTADKPDKSATKAKAKDGDDAAVVDDADAILLVTHRIQRGKERQPALVSRLALFLSKSRELHA